MSGGWPSTIDPVELADQGARLSGELPLKGMQRLVEMCLDDVGTIRVDLQFERSEGDGIRTMRGDIEARLHFTCQRCLGPFELRLSTRPRLLLLRPGEHEHLAETGEALIVEQPLSPSMLVEEELLLVMPMIPMHEVAECPASGAAGKTVKKVEKEPKPNPFSVLEKLKRTD
jgi:uncharacterized protein